MNGDGDVSIVGTIGELVVPHGHLALVGIEIVSLCLTVREAWAGRGCDGSVGEVGIVPLGVIRMVFFESIGKLLVVEIPPAEVSVVE